MFANAVLKMSGNGSCELMNLEDGPASAGKVKMDIITPFSFAMEIRV